ncbi:MAG: gluconokinase [Anaerolineales bacterium]|nr:gluconokinase [Anaerolineales bacterium]
MSKVIILMGVSGSGKTTVGQALSSALGWPFIDGDDFHSPENVKKMSRGIPLSDEDRLHWLETLSHLLSENHHRGENLVLACSALKRIYRDQLRSNHADLIFVYLAGDIDMIRQRMQAREVHYMKPGMLESQFQILEPPQNALQINIDRPINEIVQEIIGLVGN